MSNFYTNKFYLEKNEIINKKVDSILKEVTNKEKEMAIYESRSLEICREIYNLNEELISYYHLREKFNKLHEQYVSDTYRLTFIVEGELHSKDFPKELTCPLCHGILPKEKEQSYVDACSIELQNTLVKIKDLEDTQKNLIDKIKSLEERKTNLEIEHKKIKTLINSNYTYVVSLLKNSLEEYNHLSNIHFM